MASAPRVLLIGWDGADWEIINPLLEAGLLPTLDGMINRGVMGNLATLEPMLSPMLWNSVATGKLPVKHGIHGFVEPNPGAGGVRPCLSTSRRTKAIWNILTQEGRHSNIVGWWASHPAEPIRGCVVTSHFTSIQYVPEAGWHVPPGTIFPAEKAGFLSQLRVFPHELTHEHIFPFIPQADRLDQENDPHVQIFAKLLADCASVHAVATALLENEPWDFSAIYYDALDHFCHAFMPFHPPKLPNIPQEKFDLYQHVVTGAYRFHDMMLARLLELAGPDTTVILCSDHGFESGSLRPAYTPREPAGPAFWHRQFGIFVAQGPGILRDERIYGASLIDIGPTVLTALGLPIGADMDGRPLTEIYEHPPRVETIPSWDDVPGHCGMHPAGFSLSNEEAAPLIQHFVALGYIEDPGADRQKAADDAEVEAKYNLARSLLWTRQTDEAITLLTEIAARRPWETRFLDILAHAYANAGYLRQAQRLIQATYPEQARSPAAVKILLGEIQDGLGLSSDALALCQQAEQGLSSAPRLLVRLGETYLRLRRMADAERVFRRALEIHEDMASAWQGLSTVYRRWGRDEEAVTAALNAVGLVYRLPEAHFNLGVALARSGDTERAVFALETALKCRSGMLKAHRWLGAIYAQDPARADKTRYHRLEVARLQDMQTRTKKEAAERRDAYFHLPDIPSPAERLQILDRERPTSSLNDERSGKSFVLVSGLPRSGTSLMMQMLEAGGLSVITDGHRGADRDNPKGYYEWESIKQIGKRPELLDDPKWDGRAMKVISMLLSSLPVRHQYKVLFMTRPIAEIVASQQQMIERLGTGCAPMDDQQLARGLRSHREETRQWLRQARHMQVFEVNYPELVAAPEDVIPKIVAFVGATRLPRPDRMRAVIDPHLHRHRADRQDSLATGPDNGEEGSE